MSLSRSIKHTLRRARVRLGPGGADVLAICDRVEGQIAVNEAACLFRLARGRKTIVEIGSFRGLSTCILAKACAGVGGVVHAIDPHIDQPNHAAGTYGQSDHEAFLANLRAVGVSERVKPIKRLSHDARADWPDTPIDLLWIDGDHSYEGVRQDLEDWAPLVRPGGILAGHDYTPSWPGTCRAWDEYLAAHPEFNGAGRELVRSVIWTRRDEDR